MKKHIQQSSVVSLVIINQNNAAYLQKRMKEVTLAMKKYRFHEIIIIDNGSEDEDTQKILTLLKKYTHIRILVLSKKVDIEHAIAAGIENAVGDSIITFNILTDPVEIIDALYLQIIKNKKDIVLTKPTYSYFDKRPLIRFVFSILLKRELNYLVYYSAGFSRRAANSIMRIRNKIGLFHYIHKIIGFRKSIVSYTPAAAIYLPEVKFFTLARYLIDSSISHSFRPLRIATTLGFIASALNFIFLIYVFIITLVKDNIAEGWITTSVIMGTMFFLLFFILTIIGEYLLRILMDSRNDPSYFIAQEYDESSLIQKKDSKLNIIT